MARHGVIMKQLISSSAYTGSGNGSWFDVSGYNEMLLFINVGTVQGAGTVNPGLQYSSDSGTTAHDSSETFSAIGTVGAQVVKKVTNFGSYVRGTYTITGSGTPTFSMKVLVKD